MTKLVQNFAKYYMGHPKIALKLLKFSQSGEISPNLVTLVVLQTQTKEEATRDDP